MAHALHSMARWYSYRLRGVVVAATVIAGLTVASPIASAQPPCPPLDASASAVKCSGDAFPSLGASNLIVVPSPRSTAKLRVRTFSTDSNGTVNVLVDDLAGHHAASTNANAVKGTVDVDLPVVPNSGWIRALHVVDKAGSATYFVVFLGGLIPDGVVSIKPNGGTLQIQLPSVDIDGFKTTPSLSVGAQTALLTFVPIASANLTLGGTLDLTRASDQGLIATIKPPGNAALVNLSVSEIDRQSGALVLSSAATFSAVLGFGALSVANPHLTLSESPSLQGDVSLRLADAAAPLTAKGVVLSARTGVTLGCDIPLDFGGAKINAPLTGLLAGLSLDVTNGSSQCDASGAVRGVRLTMHASLPAWLAQAPNNAKGADFRIVADKAGLRVEQTSVDLLVAAHSVQAGPITIGLTKFSLQTNQGNQLVLALVANAKLPGLSTAIDLPGISSTLLGGKFAVTCPQAAPGGQFSIAFHCNNQIIDGLSASGSVDITELGTKITTNGVVVSFDAAGKVSVSGDLATTNSKPIDIAIGAATFHAAAGTVHFGKNSDTAGDHLYVAIDSGDLKLPSGKVGDLFGSKLNFTNAGYDGATHILTIGSLTTVAGYRAGLRVESASTITADLSKGDSLSIGVLVVTLTGGVQERVEKTEITPEGYAHDTDDVSDVKLTLKGIQFRSGGFDLTGAEIVPEKSCNPSSPVSTNMDQTTKPNVAAAVSLPAAKRDKEFYHLGWVDVCFDIGYEDPDPATPDAKRIRKTAFVFDSKVAADQDRWQIQFQGQIRLRKIVDNSARYVPFVGRYRSGTFALRADFSDQDEIKMGGETVHVGVVRLVLSDTLRHLDAEVSVQAHELHDSTFYFRHIGLEQRWEVLPRGLRSNQLGWRTYPVVDPDIGRTGASLATKYIPALLGILSLKGFHVF